VSIYTVNENNRNNTNQKNMHPTKRQIAKVIRQTARIVGKHPRVTTALFEVCKPKGRRASAYYDNAVRAIKAFTPLSFSRFMSLPRADLQRTLRRTARAIEHGLVFKAVTV
jgi:hypothetical protein